MKKILIGSLLLCASAFSAEPAKTQRAEMWKGQSPGTRFNIGAMGGLAIVGSSAGGVLLGNVAVKILNRGFVGNDINDQVFVETQVGPVFFAGSTHVNLNFHLRWDFHKDEDVSLYALGGAGSLISSNVAMSSQFYPRFGLGAMYHFAMVSARAEISHESITAGVQFDF